MSEVHYYINIGIPKQEVKKEKLIQEGSEPEKPGLTKTELLEKIDKKLDGFMKSDEFKTLFNNSFKEHWKSPGNPIFEFLEKHKKQLLQEIGQDLKSVQKEQKSEQSSVVKGDID
jgi:hypothetical protein